MNLEERVGLIERQLMARGKLSDSTLSKLFTSKKVVSDRIYRLRYDGFGNPAGKLILSLIAQRSELEGAIIREELSSWSDKRALQESLQQATEELAFERTRLKLVEMSEKQNPKTQNDTRERD